MVRWALSFLLLFTGVAYATTDEGHPALYDVYDVTIDDVLNVRSGPGLEHEIVAHLPPNAMNIEVIATTDDRRWGLVNAGEISGWASLRYLARQPEQVDGAFPLITRCFGTEPFWDISFVSGRMSYADPITERIFFDEIWQSYNATRPDRFAFGTDGLTATVRQELCSDGMSDMGWGLQIDLIRDGESRTFLSGCCTISP